MKVSLAWLNDHIDLVSSERSVFEISEVLTFAGVEVEKITGLSTAPEGVVLGKVLSFEKHSNADRLRVCQIDAGEIEGENKQLQIICGADNFKENDLIALALPNTDLGGGFVIKKSKIRGIESEGMMCSEQELGLSESSDGIMIFEESYFLKNYNKVELGQPLNKICNLEGNIQIEVTPNRPDLLSHLGLARDLSAILDTPLKTQVSFLENSVEVREAKADDIQIDSNSSCSIYTKRLIKKINISESPKWLKNKLTSIGMKPRNSAVDITNFMLFDMGQPMHVFDADKISGGIVVRKALQGEEFTGLDKVDYKLKSDTLVVADSEKVLAIAGIIGGESSAVTNSTKNILLECAHFLPSDIRKTSRALGISTDSSYRFERGVDSAQVLGASEKATNYILEICGGEVEDLLYMAGEIKDKMQKIDFDFKKAKELIGAEITIGEISNILTKFNILPTNIDQDYSGVSTWKIPTYRLDLSRHVDLVEEIMRCYGTDKVPMSYKANFFKKNKQDYSYDYILQFKNYLCNNGFYEVQTIKLLSESKIKDAFFLNDKEKRSLAYVSNPISTDYSILAPSLIPNLLQSAEYNLRQNQESIKIFEINKVYFKFNKNYVEKRNLAMLLGGKVNYSSWDKKSYNDLDVFYLSGIISSYLKPFSVTIKPVLFKYMSSSSEVEEIMGGEIIVENKKVGFLGQLPEERARQIGAKFSVYVLELEADKLLEFFSEKTKIKFEAFPKYPEVHRDISISKTRHVTYAHLNNFFKDQVKKNEIMHSFYPFDLFTDLKKDGSDNKNTSIAFSIKYLHHDRTLTSEEVDKCHQRVCSDLIKSLEVKIR